MTAEMEQERQDARQLVVIGSSAGGIDALSTLVATLPTDFPAPIVIAQHLDPTRRSALHRFWSGGARCRSDRGRRARDAGTRHRLRRPGQPPCADHQRGDRPARGWHGATDALDRPAPGDGRGDLWRPADRGDPHRAWAPMARRARTIVKKLGGTVIIQNPETAAHPGMPRSLAPTTVDIVANLMRIGPIVYDLLAGARCADPAGGGGGARSVSWTRCASSTASISAATSCRRSSRRLQRRIVATGTGDIADYLAYLDTSPEEYRATRQHLPDQSDRILPRP